MEQGNDQSYEFQNTPLTKIVSGGQTGVDRAALDAAIFLELEHGGWCPLGRRAEDGKIPACYNLKETRESDYASRTEKNVIDSDGTLIICRGKLTGGTRLTKRFTKTHSRNCLVIDLAQQNTDDSIRLINSWIYQRNISVMNVAGPRESTCPGITESAGDILVSALSR